MCRFLAFHTKDSLSKEHVNALIKASRNDIFSKYGSHPDGWGLVAFVRNNSKWRVFYYRSEDPIYEDPYINTIIDVIKGEEIIGVIHARKAGSKFLIGLTHTHPYFTRAGIYDLYFAHNGSVSRQIFKEPNKPYTDSYLILEEIKNLIETNNITPFDAYSSVIERLKDYATSLNSTLIFYNKSGGPSILIGYYYNKNRLINETKEEYYKLYTDNKGYVFSSTIKYYLDKLTEIEELVLGSIVHI
ncbi:MAG: class II glutamine amidotransferase [Saccharolobus sp.]|jgi:glutamine amidotransferase|uniref:class II glutamine amidotransferase n=1 Tax=Saccharolobus sp. TaxID=2100761 RepID=UPI0028CDDCEC|nr:class II glutamine amidotransferase [Saccharolobus sp.]MDT7860918.1 class II glutamine amidotransferase [Saccharolobus sp.]